LLPNYNFKKYHFTVFSIEVAIDEVGNLNYLLVGFDTKKAQTSKAVGVTFLFGAI
jgi:hypothetical protein